MTIHVYSVRMISKRDSSDKTYKEWDKIYEIIPKIIKKIKFNPATNNQKATKSKIQVVVKIDTYQYPSDISKKLFPRLTP